MLDWSPKQIVDELDRYIVGQDAAKRAVAIALRNRYRRSRLPEKVREEIMPKNILMIGPTGVGKTEIARRMAKLVDAPFVKVEATKFTEVGYVGRDVESMVRDLVEASIHLVKGKKEQVVRLSAESMAESRLVDLLLPQRKRPEPTVINPLEALFSGQQQKQQALPEMTPEEKETFRTRREEITAALRAGKLEDTIVEIEVEEQPKIGMDFSGLGMDINMNDMLGGILPTKKKKRHVPVSEARRILIQQEMDRLIDMDEVITEALRKAEQEGIIFIDEIDKIASRANASGPDVSREGVQRDILPIVEGSTVTTKYGPVKTDYILFIAAGAFHVSKVSDLIPELQGRFPIVVELNALTREDFRRIVSQPENAATKQYAALLSADNVNLTFTEGALNAIADYAYLCNEVKENIGARRLHTVMEELLEDISFNANGRHPPVDLVIDEKYVHEHLIGDVQGKALGKYII